MLRGVVPTLLLLLLALLVPCSAQEQYLKPGPVRLTREGNRWAESTLRHLSLEQKIGQMLMVRANTEFLNVSDPRFLQLRDMVRRYHLGGILLTVRAEGALVFRNQPYEAAMFTNRVQREAELPLIVAADFERGLGMRFYSTVHFPHAMAFGAVGDDAAMRDFARVVAQEARAIGVHWNFFPIVDVNSVPQNPIINTRAFGEDPGAVGDLAVAYVEGARDFGMLTTAKHFPGHGDVSADTHLGMARVEGDRKRLDAVELVPFVKAIDGGVDAVMTAHVTVPALEPDPDRPATISRNVIGGLLKEELGFQGLVVTDAMDMGAITRLFPGARSGRAAVEAVKAGNDMVLLPFDLDAAFNALLAAVRSGELSESQIDASVLKVLRAKAAIGLYRARLVDPEALPTIVNSPVNLAFAQQVADRAVTLVRDNGQALPLKKGGTPRPSNAYQIKEDPGSRVLAVIFTDDMRSDSGRSLERELKARAPDARIFYVDPGTASGMTPEVLAAAERAQQVVAAVISIPSAGKMVKVQGQYTNTVALGDAHAALLRQLLERAAGKTVLVSLGSPYLAAGFPEVQTYLCTFSNAPVSEVSAVKALFSEIPIHGRLPVTIPAFAARGAGLDRPALVSRKGGLRRENVRMQAAGGR